MSASKPAVLLVKQIIKQSSGQPQWPAQSSDVAPHRRRWPPPARRGSRIAPAERSALDLPCPRSASDGNLSMDENLGKIWGETMVLSIKDSKLTICQCHPVCFNVEFSLKKHEKNHPTWPFATTWQLDNPLFNLQGLDFEVYLDSVKI